jgi:hypothetical protein
LHKNYIFISFIMNNFLFTANQTPKSTSFLQNRFEVGLFQGISNNNLFEETFQCPVEGKKVELFIIEVNVKIFFLLYLNFILTILFQLNEKDDTSCTLIIFPYIIKKLNLLLKLEIKLIIKA